jgi:hypothetical protein
MLAKPTRVVEKKNDGKNISPEAKQRDHAEKEKKQYNANLIWERSIFNFGVEENISCFLIFL